MARDAAGRYWYAKQPDSWDPESGFSEGTWVHAQPGSPGAVVGGAPHVGSLDAFIESAIPLAIAAAGAWVVSLAGEPQLTAAYAKGARTAAAESSAEIPVKEQAMWEEEWEGDFGGGSDIGGGGFEWDEVAGAVLDVARGGGNGGQWSGDYPRGPLMVAAGAAAVTLGARLAQMFGRGSGTFVINGIKGSMNSLWPLVRKYGPTSVAAALGVGAASLAELLMRAPTSGRKRRRGISARDLATTARVGRFNKKVNRLFGAGRGRGGRSRGYPRSQGRHYH